MYSLLNNNDQLMVIFVSSKQILLQNYFEANPKPIISYIIQYSENSEKDGYKTKPHHDHAKTLEIILKITKHLVCDQFPQLVQKHSGLCSKQNPNMFQVLQLLDMCFKFLLNHRFLLPPFFLPLQFRF